MPGDEDGAAARHGASPPRGLAAPRAAPPGRGRFGRMFGHLPVRDIGDAGIDALIGAIHRQALSEDNPDIPAGYTYLGQFVDHDITFDPGSLLQKVNDPDALADFRTPRLDLDSLYGSGPADQPYLYEWTSVADRGVKLLTGTNDTPGDCERDLPRNAQGVATIGDPRNDENLIVSQLHLLFIRFHNNVVDYVRHEYALEGKELFAEAQRLVRWHYQWIVAHDFLRRVAGDDIVGLLLEPAMRGETGRRYFLFHDEPYIPVEFSGAAYRFGHSMVRGSYLIKRDNQQLNPSIFRAPDAPPDPDNELTGLRRLPAALELDWECFFEIPGALDQTRHGKRIDLNFAPPLKVLPAEISPVRELARLNLMRARALELPAGPDVARAMGEAPLTAGQLELPSGDAHEEIRKTLTRGAPLWYYVLAEAHALEDGKRLGPVGGRIVAEVLVGLLEGDPQSYLRQFPRWTPELAGADGRFTMSELVQFARRPAVADPASPAPSG